MGRPRKRQQKEKDHTHAYTAGFRSLEEPSDEVTASSLLNPGLATFSSNGMGALDLRSASSGVAAQQAGNDSYNFESHGFDATYPPFDELGFPPIAGFPTWNPTQDFSTIIPISSPNPAPLQISPASDLGATGNHSFENIQGGCSCLGNLFATLATFQSLPAPSFPYSMGALKKALHCGYEAVRCQICPQEYNTAIQNSMLLVALLQMLINEYTKLLMHIDERATNGESIAFRVGEVSACSDRRHTGTSDCPMAITVDLNGEEWQMLARKGVRQEVLGSADGDQSLLNIIQAMKDRQVLWHNGFFQDCHPPRVQDPNDSVTQAGGAADRMCAQIVYIDHLKRLLESLKL